LQIEALKEAFGDDVDVLMLVSRTHYTRTMTTVRASTGAAQAFLSTSSSPQLADGHAASQGQQQQHGGGAMSVEKMLTEGWSASIEQYYAAKGGRDPKRSGTKYASATTPNLCSDQIACPPVVGRP